VLLHPKAEKPVGNMDSNWGLKLWLADMGVGERISPYNPDIYISERE
jgi:hypothetical protein